MCPRKVGTWGFLAARAAGVQPSSWSLGERGRWQSCGNAALGARKSRHLGAVAIQVFWQQEMGTLLFGPGRKNFCAASEMMHGGSSRGTAVTPALLCFPPPPSTFSDGTPFPDNGRGDSPTGQNGLLRSAAVVVLCWGWLVGPPSGVKQ